jgi:hypothetical protein
MPRPYIGGMRVTMDHLTWRVAPARTRFRALRLDLMQLRENGVQLR